MLDDGKIQETHIVTVSDKHALAAHEHWHRKTKGRWIDPPVPPKNKTLAQYYPKRGTTGLLLALQRDGISASQVNNIAVQGPVLLTIRFASLDQVVEVDFAVVEISHTEYEVRVLDERRSFRKPPQLPEGAEEPTKKDRARLQEMLVGTAAAIGRVRTIDMVGGHWGADSRKIADNEFDFQERARRQQYFDACRARQAALLKER
eukprot:CAMPEP_0197627430 /NCGR_PEP_ID=MMETSP1338-20131121/6051_1 /TAXON_ID=43686 ORGANISM="Pelagodinium beii, Strain RCC1491" /NCGR_SAMPLE_ID=MMETSP1338 /ASSEMBLY_ACC=CAM_ASM_000754 /LENGTH=203 /DNA_ID=CAMNT_0043198157 /DNA_START=159 /DNA_END=770 /DNA_ORIENTATION=+